MHSATIIFVVLLILSCNSLAFSVGSRSVSLYSQKRFRGRPITVDMTTVGCYKLSTNVASISTDENCIRLYASRNCNGEGYAIYRRCNIDVERCNVDGGKMQSMSLC